MKLSKMFSLAALSAGVAAATSGCVIERTSGPNGTTTAIQPMVYGGPVLVVPVRPVIFVGGFRGDYNRGFRDGRR